MGPGIAYDLRDQHFLQFKLSSFRKITPNVCRTNCTVRTVIVRLECHIKVSILILTCHYIKDFVVKLLKLDLVAVKCANG